MSMRADLAFPMQGRGGGVNVGGITYPASIIVENRGGQQTSEGAEERLKALEARLLWQEETIQGLKQQILNNNGPSEDLLEKLIREKVEMILEQREEMDYDDDDEFDDDGEDAMSIAEDVETKEETEEFADEYEVKIRDQLKLVEQSALAIDVLNTVTLQLSWSSCSPNTYGFLIRNILLMGSKYKNQLVEDTSELLFLSLTGAFFAAGMQFILAYTLFVKMPDYYDPVTGENKKRGVSEGGTAPLPSYSFPAILYQKPNDICRTEQIVQIICIGLFLFYIVNNIPGIIKHVLIILRSERFISKAEDDVTKIHYWRESDFSRQKTTHEVRKHYLTSLKDGGDRSKWQLCGCGDGLVYVEIQAGRNDMQCSSCEEQIKGGWGMKCRSETHAKGDFVCSKCFSPSGRIMMPSRFNLELPKASFVGNVWNAYISSGNSSKNNLDGSELPRSFYEITDARNFLAEVMQDLDDKPLNLKKAGLSFAEKAKFNLVRADYLSPNFNAVPSLSVFLPFAHWLRRTDMFRNISGSGQLYQAVKRAAGRQKNRGKAKQMEWAPGRDVEIPMMGRSSAEQQRIDNWSPPLAALHSSVCPKQFKDLPYFVELYPFSFRFIFFRFLAFMLGVVPEVLTLLMITITGIQYILWSGFKIGSDSSGIEEIVLATVAITFIYDIDEAIYDHILPERYKEAHERDQFEIIGWTAKSSSGPMQTLMSWPYNQKLVVFMVKDFIFKICKCCKPDPVDLAGDREKGADAETGLSALGFGEVKPAAKASKSVNKCRKVLDAKWSKQRNSLSPKKEQTIPDSSLSAPSWIAAEQGVDIPPISEKMACKFSEETDYNDLYLALQYPFLYGKKLQKVFSIHVWEMLLEGYGTRGLHYFTLLVLTLAIVGQYRLSAQCNRFAPTGWNRDSMLSIWATQPWPATCVMSSGNQVKNGSPVKDLYKSVNDNVMPVSCGANGYLPDPAELDALQKVNYAKTDATIPG